MRVQVDVDACVGAGQCVLAAADVFDQRDSDGVVVLLDEQPDSDRLDAVRQAAMLCPTAAIRLEQ
ncbi:ferredoxin [Kribbella sp. NPDC050820]|uniref:ferredoxin n=1 Tax=Kribbella sp. NPDC050820 TaxID=3155408 RepID=UPI00340014D6